MNDIPIERSDDRHRGQMPHIKHMIEHVRGLRAGAVCYRCRGFATHLIDATRAPRAVCGPCAEEWRKLSPLARAQARNDFERRGGQ